jgi:ribose transport system ATP-binding protein
MVRLLAEQGTAVLIVSHDLKEVLEIADRVTALRNGRVTASGVETAGLDEAALIRLVLGRDGGVGDFVAMMPSAPSEERAVMRNISGGRVREFSASVARGEVVGITGTVDSGLSDLAPLLGGARRGAGTLTLGPERVDLASAPVAKLLAAGLTYIPQDRHADGLAIDLTLEENITLPHLRQSSVGEIKRGRGWKLREAREALERFDVRPPNPHAVVATLSGGNQQKVLMGKWLLGNPRMVVLDDPTQAVDVGARAAVLEATRQAAVDGAAVVLCSSEVEDLAAVCDRVLVLQRGRIARELSRPFTSDDVLEATIAGPNGESA